MIGLILGIVSSVMMFIPFINFATTISGLIVSFKARKLNVNQGLATAGLVLNIVFLTFSVVFMILLIFILATQSIDIFDIDIFNFGNEA